MIIEESNWIPLVFSIVILFFSVATLVSFYGNFKTHPWYVSTVCVVGWFFPFWIVLLLPLDMASTLYEDCGIGCRRPFTWVSQSFLYVAWRTIYWTSFCLTWMLIPMMQAYVNTGEFNVLKRLVAAAKVNVRFYMIYVVVGIVGLFYLFFKGGITTRAKLQAFVMAMANSWGLFLVIMLMGYGLVAVPRKLWYASDTNRHLNELYSKAPRVKEECIDSELEFNELAKAINTLSHRPIRNDPNLGTMVDDTVKRFPFVKHPNYADREHTSRVPQLLTEEYIVTLNRNMILATRMKDRKTALWNNLLSEVYYLQDIETNKANSDRRFHSNLRPLEEPSFWTDTRSRIEWWWVIMFRSALYRALSVLLALVSICILWSELTFNIRSPLISIVGIAINACGLNYAAVEVLSFLTLTWMCICVYSSLFKIRFFNLYLLIPNHHTDSNSLLWFTGYMCKMMAPLCYNYINLLGPAETPTTTTDHTETVFSKFMGKADLVPFLGSTFLDWFPVVVLIPALSALFNVSSLRWFGGNGESDPENGGMLDVSAAEGKDLVMEERRLIERNISNDAGAPIGLVNRAKSFFGIRSSDYGRIQLNTHNNSISSSSGSHQNEGVLSSSLRQERDKRLDAILERRSTTYPESSSTTTAAANYQQPIENDQIPLNAKLQSFGDNVKSRLGQFFTARTGNSGNSYRDAMPVDLSTTTAAATPTSRYSSEASPPPAPPLPDKSNSRPAAPSGGRVLGRINNTSASSASSRPLSPNPFQNATTARGNQTNTVSPFARFDNTSSS